MVNESETWSRSRVVCHRQMARSARCAPCASLKKPLHDAIFKGVEGDDHQPSAGFQCVLCRAEAPREFAQFVIDVDAERLERPRRGMAAVDLGRLQEALHQARKLARALEGLFFGTILDDRPGDEAGFALVAEVIKNIGQQRLARGVDDIGSARASERATSGHAHVERAVGLERKSALGSRRSASRTRRYRARQRRLIATVSIAPATASFRLRRRRVHSPWCQRSVRRQQGGV